LGEGVGGREERGSDSKDKAWVSPMAGDNNNLIQSTDSKYISKDVIVKDEDEEWNGCG
jgi:hypothetical protein